MPVRQSTRTIRPAESLSGPPANWTATQAISPGRIMYQPRYGGSGVPIPYTLAQGQQTPGYLPGGNLAGRTGVQDAVWVPKAGIRPSPTAPTRTVRPATPAAPVRSVRPATPATPATPNGPGVPATPATPAVPARQFETWLNGVLQSARAINYPSPFNRQTGAYDPAMAAQIPRQAQQLQQQAQQPTGINPLMDLLRRR